ncbi:hypothetical protein FDB15_14505 [Clostridium botulinum]|uniref:hypothetical protein n=1 Tax=unclassified Clostridium TaxID=2614128 RepID=UPI000506501D|nr:MULTISPECIES: hypothetical protein [unclassified Clostridium]AIY80804.1 hypothetical protein U728_1629 [Clostridium botulinum 202F]KAI3344964.1 hypothetical protein CIT17_15225 [Clostridium botulinum]KFX53850.1 hypothetical protein KU40_18015 [Clostridium botulinum]KON14013.1 hypothetical protein ACP50_08165 [Clostridium botulinum]MBY6779960.1 hypothetical protein [Clostridium botulinum]
MDLWFDDLSYQMERKTNLYVDVPPFSKRLNLNKNELENILESNDIEPITIINIDKILNKTIGLMNHLKIE